MAMLVLAPAAAADIINVPADQPMIQMAIQLASDGDEIVVQPGQYIEHLDLLGKAITIRSIDPQNPIIVDLTRVVGPATNPTVRCVTTEGPDTILRGLTFTHLHPLSSGHGMYIDAASPTVEYCVFRDNHTTEDGGGMSLMPDSDPTLRHCRFDGNTAENGGGMHLQYQCFPIIDECTFSDNVANDQGGGLGCSGGIPDLTDSTFSGNSAARGGGMYLQFAPIDWAFSGCHFSENDASDRGGGLYLDFCSLEISSCVFSSNTAETGAGVFNSDQAPRFTSCDFLGNTASNSAGGVYNDTSTPTFTNCYFEGNGANRNGGMRNWLSDPRIVRCTFIGDTSNSRVDSVGGSEWTLDVPNPPPAMGACCLGSDCVVTTEGECLAAGGTYHGDYTSCADVTCPEDCLGDLDGDGVVSQADLGILLSVYGDDCP
jgi:Right handed beta helix region